MKRISITAFIVFALVIIDASITMTYAKTKTTIFKVTEISPGKTLKLRAWPSTKSRIINRLPYNAIDLTETGKQRIIDKTKWLEVNWQDKQGWVEANYLTKTGVLVSAGHKASRNNKSLNSQPVQEISKSIVTPDDSLDAKPAELDGDRYDQPTQMAASEIRTAFTENEEQSASTQMLLCDGTNPKYWNIKMDVADRNMQIRFSKNQVFNVPINYHAWATPNKLRMNIGGNQGRNIVDVNLEKTNACYNGITKTRFSYEVNATINKDFYTGCCEVVQK